MKSQLFPLRTWRLCAIQAHSQLFIKRSLQGHILLLLLNQEDRRKPNERRRRRKMKTLFSTVLIAMVAIGLLVAASPGKAEAWYRGPAVGFSLVVPPFGVSVGAPAPYYYYDAPVYAAPPYPVYPRYYYGYGPYYGYRYWGTRGWRGDWHYGRHSRHWR